mmetsp:Transcript_6689/g.21566  ORF Transcript_6689/g.21566 Transcript_6689/m.21566 type:complete len:208 (+) Transcript_6689:530-1153(+)
MSRRAWRRFPLCRVSRVSPGCPYSAMRSVVSLILSIFARLASRAPWIARAACFTGPLVTAYRLTLRPSSVAFPCAPPRANDDAKYTSRRSEDAASSFAKPLVVGSASRASRAFKATIAWATTASSTESPSFVSSSSFCWEEECHRVGSLTRGTSRTRASPMGRSIATKLTTLFGTMPFGSMTTTDVTLEPAPWGSMTYPPQEMCIRT